MTKDPAFLLYYKDILVSCADWDADALGWYLRLICHQADKPEGLPNDLETLAQLAGVKMSQYQRFVECFKRTLEAKFEANALGKLINIRLSQVLISRGGYKERQSLRGVVGYYIKQAIKLGINDKMALKNISESLFEALTTESTKEEKESAFKRTLEAYASSNKANANVNVNIDVIETKGVQGENEVSSSEFRVQSSELPTPSNFPKIEDVLGYFSEKGVSEQVAKNFFFHYTAQGWTTKGGTPITRWKMKAEQWLLDPEKFRSLQDDKGKPESPMKVIDSSKYDQYENNGRKQSV